MVQVLIDAPTVDGALTTEPTSLAFAQHEGSETALWTEEKVHRDGDHVAVYPGQGSHAAYYTQAQWFGEAPPPASGATNAGAGDGRAPAVVVLPDTPTTGFEWLSFTGRRKKAPSFNNGPTGPPTKTQWAHPVRWQEDEGRPGGRRPAAHRWACGHGLLRVDRDRLRAVRAVPGLPGHRRGRAAGPGGAARAGRGAYRLPRQRRPRARPAAQGRTDRRGLGRPDAATTGCVLGTRCAGSCRRGAQPGAGQVAAEGTTRGGPRRRERDGLQRARRRPRAGDVPRASPGRRDGDGDDGRDRGG